MAIQELTQNEALQGSLSQTDAIQAQALDLSAFAKANTTSSNSFTGYYATCAAYLDFMTRARVVPGINQFAKDQLGDQTKDYNAWASAVEAAVQGYLDTYMAFYPTCDGTPGDWMQQTQLTATGVNTRSFTPAQSSPALTDDLDAIAAVPPIRE